MKLFLEKKIGISHFYQSYKFDRIKFKNILDFYGHYDPLIYLLNMVMTSIMIQNLNDQTRNRLESL